MIYGKKAFHFVICFLMPYLIMSCHPYESQILPGTRKGWVDLSGFDVVQGGVVELNGQWEFYWQQLLTPDDFMKATVPAKSEYLPVPSLWTDYQIDGGAFDPNGYATYRLQVNFAPTQTPMALTLGGLMVAHRFWVNGQLLSEDGLVGATKEKEIAGRRRVELIPLPPTGSKTGSIELVLQISNHSHWSGGVYLPVRIGPEAVMRSQLDRDRWILVFYTHILLVMGVYHLVLYMFRRQDLSLLYFGTYCLLWMMNFIASDPQQWMIDCLFPDIPPMAVQRIDMMFYFFTIPVMLLFLRSLFPDETPGRLPRVYLSTACALSLLLFCNGQVRHAGIVVAHMVSVSAMVFSFVILAKALFHRRPSSALIFSSGIVLAACGFNDILQDMQIIDTGFIMSAGLLVFICFQSCALALRFSKAFATAENLSAQLHSKNIALSSMDKLKDQFLANTSHELRTPLFGIIGIADSLLAGAAGALPEPVRNNLALMATSGRRLAGLVNDLLDFSRLKNKDLHLNTTPIDLRTLVDTVLTVLKPLADAKGLCLVHDLPHRLPAALGDEDRLQQILINLIGNAIKFTEKGRVTITATAGNPQIEVAIIDTGIGIPTDKLGDIFLSFEQADASAAREFGGTGLGLSITKHLVELHGGSIRVESTLGRGTTFFFTLPTSIADSKPVEPRLSRIMEDTVLCEDPDAAPLSLCAQPHSRDGQSGYDVLVVDDDPINIQVCINHLKITGHGVRTATSGSEALQIIRSDKTPDLVLLDIMMPGMTGFEVCQKLRDRYTASTLPVIMLTARNRVSDLVEGFTHGANDYLTKPFAREELLSRVNAQLQLKEAYRTLAENVRLKRELARRRETEQDLLLTQHRLSGLLDAVDDAVIAVNESEEVTFSNRACLQLLGYTREALLGQPVWSILDSSAPEALRPILPNTHHGPGDTAVQDVVFRQADGAALAARILIAPLELEDERLSVFLVRNSDQGTNGSDTNPVLALIFELNRNQERLRLLEETLAAMLPKGVEQAPKVRQEITAIDTALEEVSRSLLSPAQQQSRKELAVSVMNLCIDYWAEATGGDKFDLARQSGLWKVYTNKDGWERTQTLDKYLDMETMPKKPRWKMIPATADFVLTFCDHPSSLRDHLETALAKLRLS